jgi:ADP-ribose pyrophosphatase YjhB (NUDIX family)
MEGSNKPYVCFPDSSEIKELPKDTKVKIIYPNGDTWVTQKSYPYYLGLTKKKKILYDGRYCAVAGFIYAIVEGKFSVLANLRGPGCPDYIGYWSCPCGYLEGYEDSCEGISRETWEECGIRISPSKFKIVGVETNPKNCNHGNVTIRHSVYLGKQDSVKYSDENRGGEKDEVSDVSWIPLDEIDSYKWAFGHRELIKKYAPPRLKQYIYKIFSFLL